MAVSVSTLKAGLALPPLTKKIDQRRIDLFEKWGPAEWNRGDNYHTNPELAKQALGGFRAPIASGRMSVEYGIQALAQWFGREDTEHSGRVDLRFMVPVVSGDTIQVKGVVTHLRKGEKGTEVNLEMWVENQKGQKTAAGTASISVAS